ncbi:MAG: hypothetical protein ACOCRU_02950 [bacterium]
MEFKGFKLNIIAIVIVLTLAVFFAGRYYYQVYNLERPLKDEVLAIEAVNDISLIERQGKIDFLVELNPGKDFYQTYQEIDLIMKEKLANNRGNILFENDNNEEFEEIYYLLQYALYEGVNNRNFVVMEERISDITLENDIENYKLWVDEEAVYLQLNDEHSSYYKRIPYQTVNIAELEGGGQYA